MGLANVAAKIAGGAAKVARGGAKAVRRGYKRGRVRARRFLRKHKGDLLEAGFGLGLAAFGGQYNPTFLNDRDDEDYGGPGTAGGGAAGGATPLPPLKAPKKAEKIISPSATTFQDQLKSILEVSGAIKDIMAKHHKMLDTENRQAVRLSKEQTQELGKPGAAVDAIPEPAAGNNLGDASSLENDFQDLQEAIQRVIDKLNGGGGGGLPGDGGGPDIDIDTRSKGKGRGRFGRALRGLGRGISRLGRGGLNLARTGVTAVLEGAASLSGTTAGVAAAGMAAAAATTGAILVGMDQFMKSTYDDADKPLRELERRYGMKAIKNSSGFTTHFEIKGKKYKSDNLPPEYQMLMDAYGPSADARTPSTRKALEYIKKNPDQFKALEVETQRRRVQAGQLGPKPGFQPGSGSFGGGGASGSYGSPQAVSATPPPAATPSGGGGSVSIPSTTSAAKPEMRESAADTTQKASTPTAPTPEAPNLTAVEAIQQMALPDVFDGDINTFPMNTPQAMRRVREQSPRDGFAGSGNVPDPTYYDVGSLPSSIIFYTPHVKPDGSHPTLAERF